MASTLWRNGFVIVPSMLEIEILQYAVDVPFRLLLGSCHCPLKKTVPPQKDSALVCAIEWPSCAGKFEAHWLLQLFSIHNYDNFYDAKLLLFYTVLILESLNSIIEDGWLFGVASTTLKFRTENF